MLCMTPVLRVIGALLKTLTHSGVFSVHVVCAKAAVEALTLRLTIISAVLEPTCPSHTCSMH